MLRFLLIFSFVLLSFSSYAQRHYASFGFEGGPNISSMTEGSSNVFPHESVVNYSAGMKLGYHFNNKISLLYGLYYEVKGMKTDVLYANPSGIVHGIVKGDFNFNFLTAPLLLQYTAEGKVNMHIGAGGFISYLLKQTIVTDPLNDGTVIKEDHTNDYSKTELGLLAAIGFSKDFSRNWRVKLLARYHIGTSKLSSGDGVGANSPLRSRTVNFFFGISYLFRDNH